MLPKPNRLPSQEMDILLRSGTRIRGDGIDLIYKKQSGFLRFAFIVSTKIDKRAVARNRMKRLMREAVHHMLPTTPSIDAIFLVWKRLPDTEKEVEAIVRGMFSKL